MLQIDAMKVRIRTSRVNQWCYLILVTLILAGCAEKVAQIRVVQPLPHGVDPTIYVTAARQKEDIVRALRTAGFHLVDGQDDEAYLLRVTVGVDQGSQACGTLNNVRYALRKDSHDLIVAEAKGWTGTCEPNVFDTVSRALRRRVVEMSREGRQP